MSGWVGGGLGLETIVCISNSEVGEDTRKILGGDTRKRIGGGGRRKEEEEGEEEEEDEDDDDEEEEEEEEEIKWRKKTINVVKHAQRGIT